MQGCLGRRTTAARERSSRDEVGSLIRRPSNSNARSVSARDSRMENYRQSSSSRWRSADSIGQCGTWSSSWPSSRRSNGAKRAAERASRAKSEFLARTGHEISYGRMNGVMGCGTSAGDRAHSAPAAPFAKTISNSAGALCSLINDILDFSKWRRQLEPERIRIGLRDNVEAIDRISPRAPIRMDGKMVAPSNSTYPARCEEIPCASGRSSPTLSQTPSIPDAGQSRAGESRGQDGVAALRGHRYGIGISEEAQANIFHALQPGRFVHDRTYGGNGLGLAICRQTGA